MENIENIMTGIKSPIRYLDSSHDNKYLLSNINNMTIMLNGYNQREVLIISHNPLSFLKAEVTTIAYPLVGLSPIATNNSLVVWS